MRIPTLSRRPRPRGVFTILALLAAYSSTACGQSTYTKPQPIRPNLPGPLSDEIGLNVAPPLIREGTFLSSARGQAIKGKTGRWFFVFDPDAQGRVLPAMVLLPNLNLAAIERAVERNPPGTRLAVTGVTTVYQGLNYLLLSAPPLMVRPDAAPATVSPTNNASPASNAPAAAPVAAGGVPASNSSGNSADTPNPIPTPAGSAAAPAPASAPAAPAAEPNIDEIVAKMDQAAGKVPALAPQRSTTSTAGAAPASATPGSNPEATASPEHGLLVPGLIASRRGRIFRTSDGALVFALDSGTSAEEPAAPLILLPSQNLTALELIAERAGENATYTMSGEVVTYRGRNYLLPRSYLANRTTEQVLPAQ